MPMLMILALTPMLLVDAAAYAAANDANADAKMPNVARHLASAYDAILRSPLLPMLVMLRHLLRANACDDVTLKCMCICVRLRLSVSRVCVCCL